MKESIESYVLECLSLERSRDCEITNLGWLAHENTNTGFGPKFLSAFNYPRSPYEQKYIHQFSRQSKIEIVDSIYQQCNGMKILGDYFIVPGVGFHNANMTGLDFFNAPYDFQVVYGLEPPLKLPFPGLVIGKSRDHYKGDDSSQLLDVIYENGSILGGHFNTSSEVIDTFSNIYDWITQRVRAAQCAFNKEKRRRMN